MKISVVRESESKISIFVFLFCMFLFFCCDIFLFIFNVTTLLSCSSGARYSGISLVKLNIFIPFIHSVSDLVLINSPVYP